jgi:hypothetical protein
VAPAADRAAREALALIHERWLMHNN